MGVLRKIHTTLVPGGLLIDTQPVSAAPPIEAGARDLGTVDMSEWALMIAAVDRRVEQALAEGLFSLEDDRRFVVTDVYQDGAGCVAETSGWAGTRLDPALERRLARIRRPVRLHQQIRLRLLRAR